MQIGQDIACIWLDQAIIGIKKRGKVRSVDKVEEGFPGWSNEVTCRRRGPIGTWLTHGPHRGSTP